MSRLIRFGHPAAFILFAACSFVVAVIASTLVTKYNSGSHDPPSQGINNDVRFLVFAGWWGFATAIVYVSCDLLQTSSQFIPPLRMVPSRFFDWPSFLSFPLSFSRLHSSWLLKVVSSPLLLGTLSTLESLGSFGWLVQLLWPILYMVVSIAQTVLTNFVTL